MMEASEKKVREQLQYLLEDQSIFSPATSTRTVAENADFYIHCWIESGIMEEMLKYSVKNPEATLWDLVLYEVSITPPLEISDEYDEDE